MRELLLRLSCLPAAMTSDPVLMTAVPPTGMTAVDAVWMLSAPVTRSFPATERVPVLSRSPAALNVLPAPTVMVPALVKVAETLIDPPLVPDSDPVPVIAGRLKLPPATLQLSVLLLTRVPPLLLNMLRILPEMLKPAGMVTCAGLALMT